MRYSLLDPIILPAIAITVVVVLALGVAEIVAHRRNLARIPYRIHVNGTRGKSSVTRLIAAGLRAGGIRTCAKVTGVLPRVIMPDGREFPVYRPAHANIIEQRRVVALAAAQRAEALVIECMALQPALQWLSEDKLVRATHGIITNARADHLDVMGPEEADVAQALAGMVPRFGQLFTAERRWLQVFRDAADDRGTDCITVASDARSEEEVLGGFSHLEHPDNVAIALRICAELGVDRQTALEGMWAAPPDPGATVDVDVSFFGRRLHFVNGFAANDPESTERLWEQALERHADAERRVAIFNCRLDRLDRSVQLANAYLAWTPADHVVLIGTGTYTFARIAVRAGLDAGRLEFLEDARAEEVFEVLVSLAGRSAVLVGMGNIAGAGLELIRVFQNRSDLEDPAAPRHDEDARQTGIAALEGPPHPVGTAPPATDAPDHPNPEPPPRDAAQPAGTAGVPPATDAPDHPNPSPETDTARATPPEPSRRRAERPADPRADRGSVSPAEESP